MIATPVPTSNGDAGPNDDPNINPEDGHGTNSKDDHNDDPDCDRDIDLNSDRDADPKDYRDTNPGVIITPISRIVTITIPGATLTSIPIPDTWYRISGTPELLTAGIQCETSTETQGIFDLLATWVIS
ncbi:unnamed protein product [Phytophthora fragariaefolia]|uniref:Unnamed protein product n=1 Tax=Phytophthora fragariaefolia TaxID=1490495 RepID=A0A9W7D4Z9_9STRA|nr:unnamed protein product [Phytophthora fragariaefolia]